MAPHDTRPKQTALNQMQRGPACIARLIARRLMETHLCMYEQLPRTRQSFTPHQAAIEKQIVSDRLFAWLQIITDAWRNPPQLPDHMEVTRGICHVYPGHWWVSAR